MSKKISTRIVQKHDFEANWIRASESSNPFIPLKGELIIYDVEVDSSGAVLPGATKTGTNPIYYDYPRFKCGDGVNIVQALPFVSTQVQIITWEDND